MVLGTKGSLKSKLSSAGTEPIGSCFLVHASDSDFVSEEMKKQ